MTPEIIAETCHEACRALTRNAKDVPYQPAWTEAPEEMRVSTIAGVKFLLANPDAPPSASHEDWARLKREAGWIYGPVKDPVQKQHPALLKWEELPIAAREKDAVFTAIVRALGSK